MGIITVNIIVNNIGADTGPFDIYDDYTGLLIVNVTKQELASGVSLDINDAASQITIYSKGICNNNLVVPITTFPLSPTPSATPSISVTQTPSITPSISLTPSETPSITPSVTISPSIIVTRTPSVTPSITPSISISNTPSITPTRTVSTTPSITVSPSPATATINWANTDGSSPFVDSDLIIDVNAVNQVTEYTTNTGTFTAANNSSISVSQLSSVGTIGQYRLFVRNVTDSSTLYDNTNTSVGSLPATVNTYSFTALGSKVYYVSASTLPPPSPSYSPSVSATPSLSISKTPSVTASPSVTPGASNSVTPSVTPSISVSKTPSVTPSISISKTATPSATPSPTPPCCTYYDLNISSTDTDNAFGNTSYENGVVYVNYTDCYDTAQSLGLNAGTYTNQICVKPNTVVNLIYYNMDNPIVATNSTKTQQGCCSAYPPPSASPTPSISITRTPTPSVTPGASFSPTPTLTPTPSTTPAAPTAFTFTDTFQSNDIIDCTGEGDLGIVNTKEYEIILRDNCANQNILAAQSTLNFTVNIICGSGTTPDNISITAGNSTYSNSYESSNQCTAELCSVSLDSYPGTLTLC